MMMHKKKENKTRCHCANIFHCSQVGWTGSTNHTFVLLISFFLLRKIKYSFFGPSYLLLGRGLQGFYQGLISFVTWGAA